ncbi:MAG: RNA polymerase sigma factor [Taibaiella sp.]|nr:RNA polymerase sigma factor [Taibaiella sp.]
MEGTNDIAKGVGGTDPSRIDTDNLYVLLRECAAGSRVAQKKLYDLHAPKAWGIIRRYIYDDEHLAEEVLNDSFYKVLTRLDQYSFQGAFEGWIRRIVINTITDHLRKKLAEAPRREVQPADAFSADEPVSMIAHKQLLELIQTLPDGQRTVFNLHVIENYAHKEIGELLGISETNSRWYLNDARRRLKEKIKFHQ